MIASMPTGDRCSESRAHAVKTDLSRRGPEPQSAARTKVRPVDSSKQARFYRVSELPLRMAEPNVRGQFRPLIQFVMCWNHWVEHRAEMLDGPPPGDGNKFHLAAIASVVHALAARDGIQVPEWVHLYKAEPEATMSGIPVTTDFGRLVKAEAPPTCAEHGVYFDHEILDR